MTAVFPEGSNYRSSSTIHSDTNATTLYTVPSGMTAAYFVWINVSDDASDARTYTLTFTDSSGSTTATLLSVKSISANTALTQDFFIAMEPGDTIKGTASAAGVHAVVTVHEIAGRNR